MTREELKQMANTCNQYRSCACCPYNPEDISRFIGDRWKGGCPNYDRKLVYAMGKGYGDVSEYEAEIERLKEECEQLRNEKWDAQDDLGCYCDEMPTRINQAVKEFAGKIKAKLNAIFGKTICSDLDTEDITDIIDELLKEYENGKDKD